MAINYSTPVSTPVGMTLPQADLLREDLQEDSIHALAEIFSLVQIEADIATLMAGSAGVTWVNPKLDFGAVGDGSTDDTAAIQAMFDSISGPVNKKSVAVYIPKGTYKITSTITVDENSGHTWKIFGDGMGASIFKWYGADAGKMFHFRGIRDSWFSDIGFNGNDLASCITHFSEKTTATVLTAASFNVAFRNCKWNEPRPSATADCVQIGYDDGVTPDLQTSEYRWFNCIFGGNGPTPNRAAINFLATSNCKNFQCDGCIFSDVDYGFYQGVGGSGEQIIKDCTFSNIGKNVDGAAIYASGNTVNVLNCKMENGTTGFRAYFVYGGAAIYNIDGGYVAGNAVASDIIILVDKVLILRNVSFEENSRVGSNNFKIQTGSGAIILENCVLPYNPGGTPLTYPPVYDGSGNAIFGDGFPRGFASGYTATARMNRKGQLSSVYTLYDNYDSRDPSVLRGSVDTTGLPAGATYTLLGHVYAVTIPYTAFQTAALFKKIDNIGSLFYGGKVLNVVADTTVPFAGPAGTLSMIVGTTGVDNGYILTHDVKSAAITRGLADADMGACLARATAIQGGYPIQAGAGEQISITLTSSSGNLSGLNAGSITVYVRYDSWK